MTTEPLTLRERSLVAKMNRLQKRFYERGNHNLYLTRKSNDRSYQDLGRFYIVNMNDNTIYSKNLTEEDLEKHIDNLQSNLKDYL